MGRRSLQVAGVVGAVLVPVAAFAATVTTEPARAPAPALSPPALGLLVVVLLIVAAYSMRTRAARGVATFVAAISLALWAAVGGATVPIGGVSVTGDQCNEEFMQEYNLSFPIIKSGCPNPIQIVAFDAGCVLGDGAAAGECVNCIIDAQDCTVGLILNFGEKCTLPTCGPC